MSVILALGRLRKEGKQERAKSLDHTPSKLSKALQEASVVAHTLYISTLKPKAGNL